MAECEKQYKNGRPHQSRLTFSELCMHMWEGRSSQSAPPALRTGRASASFLPWTIFKFVVLMEKNARTLGRNSGKFGAAMRKRL